MLHLLYQPYKWLVFIPLLVLLTLFWGTLCILICLLSPRWGSLIAARSWAKCNMYITPARVIVHGLKNIQPHQSYVITANHLSQYDIFALYGWLPLDMKWVMKQEMRQVPVIGFTCHMMGHIFLDRSNKARAVESLQKAKDQMIDGTSILFFPEGTRSIKKMPFKSGAFIMAKDLNLPILPITIKGTDKVLPPGSINLFPGTIEMTIHPSINTSQVEALSPKELAKKPRGIIYH